MQCIVARSQSKIIRTFLSLLQCNGLIKGGGAELVLHHVAVCNKQLNLWMKEEVVRQKEDGGRIKVGKLVREAVVRNNFHVCTSK